MLVGDGCDVCYVVTTLGANLWGIRCVGCMWVGMPFTMYMYGIFLLTVFSDSDHYKFYLCEAHFHAERIGASPMIIVLLAVTRSRTDRSFSL